MTIPRLDGLDKNYFINGGMEYSQRLGNGEGSVSGGTSAYELDRWRNDRNGSWSGSPTIARVPVTVPGQIKIKQAMQMSGANDSGAGTSEHFIEQRIESIFAQDLAGKPISFGFHYNESEFQEAEILIHGTTVKDNWSTPNLFQIGSSVFKTLVNDSSWQQILLENVVLPSTVDNGLRIQIKIRNAENTGVAITTQLTGFKLNIGTKLQEFSYMGRDLKEELSYCKRYYEKSYDLDTAPGTITWSGTQDSFDMTGSTAGPTNGVWAHFAEQKRVSPVGTIYNPLTGATGTWIERNGNQTRTTNIDGTHKSVRGMSIAVNLTVIEYLSHVGGHWTADAEL